MPLTPAETEELKTLEKQESEYKKFLVETDRGNLIVEAMREPTPAEIQDYIGKLSPAEARELWKLERAEAATNTGNTASDADLERGFLAADAAGNTEDAQALADEIERRRAAKKPHGAGG